MKKICLLLLALSFNLASAGLLESPSGKKYMTTEIVGQGSFGKVTLAREVGPNTAKWAVKSSHAGDDYRTAAHIESNFLRVFNSMSLPVVHLEDSFEQSGQVHLVLERLESDLTKYQKTDGRSNDRSRIFPLQEVRQVVRNVLLVLQGMHFKDIIHTDIKPENIMVQSTAPFRVKVIDFGNAIHKDNSESGEYIQTRWYRAPEILLRRNYTPAIDIWSLGCVLYELATGQVLFRGANSIEQLTLIQKMLLPNDLYLVHLLKEFQIMIDKHPEAPPEEYIDPFLSSKLYSKFMGPMETTAFETDVLTSAELTDDAVPFADLLIQMLQIDPDQRITAEDALRHPFLRMPVPPASID